MLATSSNQFSVDKNSGIKPTAIGESLLVNYYLKAFPYTLAKWPSRRQTTSRVEDSVGRRKMLRVSGYPAAETEE